MSVQTTIWAGSGTWTCRATQRTTLRAGRASENCSQRMGASGEIIRRSRSSWGGSSTRVATYSTKLSGVIARSASTVIPNMAARGPLARTIRRSLSMSITPHSRLSARGSRKARTSRQSPLKGGMSRSAERPDADIALDLDRDQIGRQAGQRVQAPPLPVHRGAGQERDPVGRLHDVLDRADPPHEALETRRVHEFQSPQIHRHLPHLERHPLIVDGGHEPIELHLDVQVGVADQLLTEHVTIER